ncbi:MAG: hypothetical protein GY755_10375 [Chloroflexi bacterium]|nr:hypothetical protein [Chloroflexota bacterium]
MRKTFVTIAIAGILVLSCSLPMQITLNPPTDQAKADLALTITAQALVLSEASNGEEQERNTPLTPTTEVSTVSDTPTPNSAPVVQESPTPSPTPTPSTATISVSLDTNCRTGPGQAYDIVGALLVGETAEVVGKNSSSNNWIIKNPDNPSTTCWIWGKYASVSGDQSALAEISVPPTPTLSVTATPTPTTAPALPNAPSNLNEQTTCAPGFNSSNSVYSGTLNWQDNSNNEDGFKIYFHLNGSGFVDRLIGTVGPNTTSFNFSEQSFNYDDLNHFLKVEAYNSAGSSNRVSILIPNNCATSP